jgi:hypothetical protein
VIEHDLPSLGSRTNPTCAALQAVAVPGPPANRLAGFPARSARRREGGQGISAMPARGPGASVGVAGAVAFARCCSRRTPAPAGTDQDPRQVRAEGDEAQAHPGPGAVLARADDLEVVCLQHGVGVESAVEDGKQRVVSPGAPAGGHQHRQALPWLRPRTPPARGGGAARPSGVGEREPEHGSGRDPAVLSAERAPTSSSPGAEGSAPPKPAAARHGQSVGTAVSSAVRLTSTPLRSPTAIQPGPPRPWSRNRVISVLIRFSTSTRASAARATWAR